MLESVLKQIDEEIARLQEAKRLLAAVEAGPARRPGRPRKSAPAAASEPKGHTTRKKKRTLSPEARERIRQAQIKRWAVKKKSTK